MKETGVMCVCLFYCIYIHAARTLGAWTAHKENVPQNRPSDTSPDNTPGGAWLISTREILASLSPFAVFKMINPEQTRPQVDLIQTMLYPQKILQVLSLHVVVFTLTVALNIYEWKYFVLKQTVCLPIFLTTNYCVTFKVYFGTFTYIFLLLNVILSGAKPAFTHVRLCTCVHPGRDLFKILFSVSK